MLKKLLLLSCTVLSSFANAHIEDVEGCWEDIVNNVEKVAATNNTIEINIKIERTENTDDVAWLEVVKQFVACGNAQDKREEFFAEAAKLMYAFDALKDCSCRSTIAINDGQEQ